MSIDNYVTFILYGGQKKTTPGSTDLVINIKIATEMQQGALLVLCSEGTLQVQILQDKVSQFCLMKVITMAACRGSALLEIHQRENCDCEYV